MRLRFAPLALTLLVGCYAGDPTFDFEVSENRATGRFQFVTFDVGQGSAAAVIAPGGCVALLDGGPRGSGAAIRAHLRGLGVTEINFAITSHYHDDHLGGIDEVEQGADGIPIGRVFDRGGTYNSGAFREYTAQFGARRATIAAGVTLSLCNEVAFEVEAVGANGVATPDENAKSVAVAVHWRGIDALAGGDLTGGAGTVDIESRIAPSLGPTELYLVHHHGSRYASNTTLLAAIRPQVSVISVGVGNSYGHPSPEALGRLRAAASDIWQTEDPSTNTRRGHVVLESSDGQAFTVTQGALRRTYTARGVTGCTTAITYRAYFTGSSTLRVYATSSAQPAASLRLSADGTSLGAMTWNAAASRYESVVPLAVRPRCVTVTADCGGASELCY